MLSVSDDRLAEALRLLRSRGFTPTGNRRGVRSFEGTIPCRGGPIKIRFAISDWDFLTYPVITVLDRSTALPPLTPHVDAKSGWLCYFAPGTVVLDRYDPAESIAQCLDQAQNILEHIQLDPTYRENEIQDEFLAHWYGGQSTKVWPTLIGTIDPKAKSSNYWIVDVDDASYFVIADDHHEVAALAEALGGKAPNQTQCPCWLFRTDLVPTVPPSMPATIKELFDWLSNWDRPLYQRFQLILEREKKYLEYKFATFAIHTPLGWLGFGFELNPITRASAKNKPQIYKQHLHNRGSSRGILRLSITEFSTDFIHSRNLMFPDLKDKTISVIGCGAIGSHVAPGLIRLGAGTGDGCLTLIDQDTLNTENLGRHSLGYPSLFKPKAAALAVELRRQFPLAKIHPTHANVRDVKKLFKADLVIDATGEEAVSEMINAWRIASDVQTPVLHVRIRGNGESVQTFWAQGKELACLRCLLNGDHKNYREERYPVLKVEPQRKQLGCRGFTPYAVSAPMTAAALCMEVIVDWLQAGEPSPRFRTRSASNANVFAVKDQDVKRLSSCPACAV